MNFNSNGKKINNINDNPFIVINRTQNNENEEKEKTIKESLKNFDKFNPFSQPSSNIANKQNNIYGNIKSSNPFNPFVPFNKIEEKGNSQKKFINNEDNTPTPGQNINIETKIENPFILGNKQKNSVQNKIIIENKNSEINENKSYNEINEIKYAPEKQKKESNKIFIPFKKINNNNLKNYDESRQNNILPIYDEDNNNLNIDNLNKMIEKENAKFNPVKSEIISKTINSNLGVIKEEQNESDKEVIALNNNNLNSKKNELNQNNNNNTHPNVLGPNNNNDLISIDNLLNNNLDEKEIQNLVKENSENINSLLATYNNNLINDIINLDKKKFKIEIDKFILYAKNKIEKLKLLDNMQSKIKEKLVCYYELNIKKQEIKINEYEKLNEYEEKLDYILMVQNQLIEKLEDINKQLKNNLKESNPIEEIKINEEEINNNIKNTESNLDKLNNLINSNFFSENNGINDEDIIKMDEIGLNNENTLFFEVLEKIYEPIKLINKEYQQLILMTSNIKNKVE